MADNFGYRFGGGGASYPEMRSGLRLSPQLYTDADLAALNAEEEGVDYGLDPSIDPVPPSVRALLPPDFPGLPPPLSALSPPSTMSASLPASSTMLGSLPPPPPDLGIDDQTVDPIPPSVRALLPPDHPGLPPALSSAPAQSGLLSSLMGMGRAAASMTLGPHLAGALGIGGMSDLPRPGAYEPAAPTVQGPRPDQLGDPNPVDLGNLIGMPPPPQTADMGGAGVRRAGWTEPTPPRTRAIRMPDGRLLFTNRDEYGGEEFSAAEGGRLVRDAQRAAGPVRTNPIDPTSATMTALVRASMRASGGEAGTPAPVGRQVPGQTPSPSGGTVSTMEGTPQQRMSRELEDATAGLLLATTNRDRARVAQELELAQMPAEQALLAQNRDVQTASFLLSEFVPQMRQVQKDAAAKLRAAQTLPDERMKQAEILRVTTERDNSLRNLETLLTLAMGIRPQGI